MLAFTSRNSFEVIHLGRKTKYYQNKMIDFKWLIYTINKIERMGNYVVTPIPPPNPDLIGTWILN